MYVVSVLIQVIVFAQIPFSIANLNENVELFIRADAISVTGYQNNLAIEKSIQI